MYHIDRNWLRFILPQACHNKVYVITILKLRNRPIQNLFNFSQRTSIDYWKWNVFNLLGEKVLEVQGHQNYFFLIFVKTTHPKVSFQKQPSIRVPIKKCSENIQEIYRRTTVPSVFSYKFAAYLFLRKPMEGCFCPLKYERPVRN